MRHRDLGPLGWEEKQEPWQKQVETVIKTCKLLRFKELGWAMKIYITPARIILRTILTLHIDQLHQSPSTGWKVKDAINNQCDSCRWFCIIIQRIQVRLRPPRGTEGEEILLVISVLPPWRLGQSRRCHPGWLSWHENGWRGNPALLSAVAPEGFPFFQERDTSNLCLTSAHHYCRAGTTVQP